MKTTHTAQKLRRFILTAFFVSALVACSGASPLRDASGKYVEVPVAEFQLKEVYVQWRDNPAFNYTVSETTYGGSGGGRGVSEGARAQALADMKTLISLYKDNTPTQLGRSLGERGVPSGQKQTVTLTPVTGYQSGAETKITIRAIVYDGETRKRWQFDLNNSSGQLLLGPRNNKPNDEFVLSYTKALVDTFVKAKLIN
jgi:hypothetical protein